MLSTFILGHNIQAQTQKSIDVSITTTRTTGDTESENLISWSSTSNDGSSVNVYRFKCNFKFNSVRLFFVTNGSLFQSETLCFIVIGYSASSTI